MFRTSPETELEPEEHTKPSRLSPVVEPTPGPLEPVLQEIESEIMSLAPPLQYVDRRSDSGSSVGRSVSSASSQVLINNLIIINFVKKVPRKHT